MEDIIMGKFATLLLFRNWRAERAGKKFADSFESEMAEGFLDLLLKFMSLTFLVNKGFRKNIKNFDGRYLFKSKDNHITVAAVFGDGQLSVDKKPIGNTHVTVTFRNARALMNYLLSPKPDILGSILRQDVVIDGNLTYLYKFAYMAKRLQLMALGRA